MRKTDLIAVLMFVGLVSCNDSGSEKKPESTDTTKSAMQADTTMHHNMDTAMAVMPMPEIPKGAKVFFVNLKDGQTVKSPVKVEMGVQGIALDSAGKIRPASGHHHLLIDAGDSLTAGTVVPKDSTHLHFGNAQKEAEVKLSPGKHKLTLQYADGIHRSYGGALAKSITVTVKQ